MHWHRTLYLAVLAGAFSAVLLPALSRATPPGKNGEIAFARPPDRYVVNVNGSGLRRVTPWKLEAGGLGELDWSPDGSHLLFRSITFASDDPGPSSGDIYTIQPDGTGLRRLTNLAAGTGIQLGSYSPDGSHIVCATNDGGTHSPGSDWPDVFVMHADGTHITPVTRTKNWEGTPQWGAAG